MIEGRIGHERPRLVDELVHLLVDGAAAALGDERRPLGDRALEVREIALELAHVPERAVALDVDAVGGDLGPGRLAVDEERVVARAGRAVRLARVLQHPAILEAPGEEGHAAARAHARRAHEDVARLERVRGDARVEAARIAASAASSAAERSGLG